MRGYYFVTDRSISLRGNTHDVACAVEAGVTVVQYRAKGLAPREMAEEGRTLRALCSSALFLINDRPDICIACGADGVHVGQDDLSVGDCRLILGKRRIIGVTVHSMEEALAAQSAGADYLGVSPIFPTATKKDAGNAVGPALISRIKSRITLPLVAIGGITLSNAPEVIAAGADCLCAISAVVAAKDVKAEIEKFQRLYQL